MGELDGKLALITGASSGFGLATAEVFARAGARLILWARRTDKLESAAAELQSRYSAQLLTATVDVRNNDQVKDAVDALPEGWREIDVLINNAGLALGREPLQQGPTDDWDRMIDTNVKGLLYVSRAVVAGMLARNSGHVINIGSIAGHEVYTGGAVYCATKHAVNAICRALRLDVMGTNIRVSSVDPGFAETEFSLVRFKGDEQRARDVYQGMTPLTAQDVAEAIFFCVTRPLHVNVSEIIIMPTDQASISQIARRKE